ncbi:HDOD domain-containing protein [Marinomonas foliarum]|uniref:HD-like signal output (HDOD) protein n=1 Tax=Marinomonas foliarum TaxID=491950 RepID=A0A369ACB4_9GAMM|nr:HDOD domain-containing protein [Marinomonas foliarum]QRV25600.1 HDOD domain-containing protein [Marinomonas foliarum]RCX06765.1 HD-like signal output (HDOD) protein [Marinomonas foliarum]
MDASIDLQTTPRLRVVHLADHTGRLQVIFPENNMLDISAVSRLTKRRFEPVNHYHSSGDPLIKPNSVTTILEASMLKEAVFSIRTKVDGAYHDITSAELEAMFSGPLNRFEAISIDTSLINRPVDNHEHDEEQILQALGRFQSIRLKQRIEETLEIPPLPASSHRIIRLSTDKSAGTDELCDVIALDPSLAAQVISWASSPYYGAPGSIESVEDAIIRVLGYDMVMNLALGLSMGNGFQAPEDGPRHYEDFWLDSVSNAVLMESLVKAMPLQNRPKLGHAYLAGLLHNFGYLGISTILPPHFSILSRYQEANAHLPSELVEMQILHFTKEQLGSWLLRYWSLPDNIWMAIRYSKKPHYYGEHAMLAKLLFVSNQLRHNNPIEPSVLLEIGLTLEEAEDCRNAIYQKSAELHKMVALINKMNT